MPTISKNKKYKYIIENEKKVYSKNRDYNENLLIRKLSFVISKKNVDIESISNESFEDNQDTKFIIQEDSEEGNISKSEDLSEREEE